MKCETINENIVQYSENISDFIKKNPEIPVCQRQYIEERVQEIYDSIVANKNEKFNIPYLGFIHCGILNRRLYILDGQHRYRAMKKYYDETKKDFLINYIVKFCSVEKELRDFFRSLNNNYNLHDIILNDEDLDISSEIKKHINEKYSRHISPSENPRLSNINLDQICSYFIVNKIVPLSQFHELTQKFEELNSRVYSEFSENKSESVKKIIEDANKKQKLYISLLFYKEVPKRTNIPKSIRIQLWNLEIGKDKMIGKCNVCSEDISFNDFHAGHVVSVKNGGSDKLDNLKILCPNCNLSMSSCNLEEFRGKYY